MQRAAAYARVSTLKQSETSIETQFEAIENFARSNNLIISKKYFDKETASGEKERPQFSQMIQDAFNGEFDLILVYKYDRFFRDNIEEQLLIRELERKNILVLSVTEKIDTTTPAGRLQRWIISGINRFYIENLQQEIKEKTKKVAERGYFLGGIPPYGFSIKEVRDPEASRNRKILIVNEKEAKVVREIFKLFAEGYSYNAIVEHLNRKGIKTRKGATWSKASIVDMLRNEKYIGVYTYNKGTKHNYHAKNSDVIRVPNAIPAIIDIETWNKVHQRIQKRNTSRRSREFLLRGIIYCGDCGAKMYPFVSKKYNKYVCSRYLRKRDAKYNGISQMKIESFVLGYIEHTLLVDIDFAELAREYNREMVLRNINFKKKVEMLELELKDIEQKLENAVNAILEGSALAKRLEAEVQKLEQRKREIFEELNSISANVEQFVTEEMIRQKYEEYLKALKGDFEAKRELVLQLINKVIVYPDGYIKVEEKV